MATRQGLNIRDVGKEIHATIRIVELMFTSSALQLQMQPDRPATDLSEGFMQSLLENQGNIEPQQTKINV